MAQSKVTKCYATRKRTYENKFSVVKNLNAILLQTVDHVIADAKQVKSVIKTNISPKPIRRRENLVEPAVTKIESKSTTKEPITKPKPTRKGRYSSNIIQALLVQTKHTSEMPFDVHANCKGNAAGGTPQEGIPEGTNVKPKVQTRKAKAAETKTQGSKTPKNSTKKPRSMPIKSRYVKAVGIKKATYDIRKAFQRKAKKLPEETLNCEQVTTLMENKEKVPNIVVSLDSPTKIQSSISCDSDLQCSPKRCLSDSELKTLHGKKECLKFGFSEDIHATPSLSTSPQKEVQIVLESLKQQQRLDSQPGTSGAQRNPDLKAALFFQEKQQLLQCGKLDDIKKRIASFESSSAVLKSIQNRKCKITSPLPLLEPRSTHEVRAPNETIKKLPAYQRFHSLATPGEPSLLLPYKYKLLEKSFHCAETLMYMWHNSKEICTFDKLQHSVRLSNKNFCKENLRQIKTVFPSAYHYKEEKSVSFINMKPGDSQYQLVISLNLINWEKDQVINSDEISSVMRKETKQNVKNSSSAFIQIDPTWFIKRREIFHSNLLNVVKSHHQKFLERLHPNIVISQESIVRWHPKFPLDSVPDIPPALLPEAEDMKKGSTAADVLNIIRGKAGEKVEKALQSVAESHGTSTEGSSNSRNEDLVKRGALKGICNDLLQKIRAREAAKIVMEMTRPQEDHKKSEMVQRIPEIVRIIRNYFITARKAAVSVDEATQKIIDSYHSSLSPDDVRQHLQLIAELFPSWLYLISISKGLFLKIDKNKNINALLDNMPKLKT